MNQALQVMMPVAQGLLQAGQPQLFNALLEDWGRAMDIDVARYMVPPPPPQPPQPPPEQQDANPPAGA